jgi:hypothetical protein
MLVRSNLTTTSPTEVLGEILTQDIFQKSQAEAMSLTKKVKGESIALKAKVSKAIKKEESECWSLLSDDIHQEQSNTIVND